MRILLIVLATIPFILVFSPLFSLSPITTEEKPSSKVNNNQKQRRLDCVIHVGLFKTGTTTIQGALGLSLYDHLVNDTYYFLGKTGGQQKMKPEQKRLAKERDVFFTFAKEAKCLFPPRGWVTNHGECQINQTNVQSFIASLRNHYNQGHHVVISWEGISLLSDTRLNLLGMVLREAGYDPRIVVTSRHYHEWVPSWIQQYFRPARYNRHLVMFEDAGGSRIPTIQQFILEDPLPYHTFCTFDDCNYDWLATDNAPAAIVRNRFQRFFNDVQVFQFNQDEGDLVTNFICQTLPFAQNTCRSLQNGAVESPPRLKEAIPREQMDYEYLAQAAYDKYNLVQYYSKQRRALAESITRHHQKAISKCQGRIALAYACDTLQPFALQCLTTKEKQLFTNRTISYEREIFPNDFAGIEKQYENVLRTKALDMMNDDKYCMIDVNKTLAEPWWDVFFTSLEAGKDPYELPDQPWGKLLW